MAARPGTRERGVMVYDISDDEYLNPGDLMDEVADAVAKEGVFIARLNTWTPDDGRSNVLTIKEALAADKLFDVFHPDWLKRQTVIEESVFYIDPIHRQTSEGESLGPLKRMQTSVKKLILEDSFQAAEETFLNGANAMDEYLGKLLADLEDKTNNVLYVQNVNLPEPLQTTAGTSMAGMAHNLHLLNNKAKVNGINTPTVYIGLENSTFNCHTEDMKFCAINRHYAGKPKVWFCIPPRYYKAFVEFILTLPLTAIYKNLNCFLEHKKLWLDPRRVQDAGIPVFTIVQKPGDILYLLPYTIHWGVNTGICYNEAMNFVCKSWVLQGMLARQRCNCIPDWACEFDIASTLTLMGADKELLSAWKAGNTSGVDMALRLRKPDLYPGFSSAGAEKSGEPAPGCSGESAPKYRDTIRIQKGLQCPLGTCPKQIKYYGEGAKKSLINHINELHKSDAANLLVIVEKGFEKKETTCGGTKFECTHCGETLTGAKKRRMMHEEACAKKPKKQ